MKVEGITRDKLVTPSMKKGKKKKKLYNEQNKVKETIYGFLVVLSNSLSKVKGAIQKARIGV